MYTDLHRSEIGNQFSILSVLSAFICGKSISARVAQLTERWSYKPEVEGLSPSLGTKLAKLFYVILRQVQVNNLRHKSGRDSSRAETVTAWDRGVRRGASASRPDQFWSAVAERSGDTALDQVHLILTPTKAPSSLRSAGALQRPAFPASVF
jgi:hypothetical protein